MLPQDRLLTKTLFLIKSTHVHVFHSPPTSHTHLLEFHRTLLIRCPQDLHRHRFAVLFPAVGLGAYSEFIRLVGERYRSWIDPVRAREVLTSTREPRERGEHIRACLSIRIGPKVLGRHDLGRDKNPESRNATWFHPLYRDTRVPAPRCLLSSALSRSAGSHRRAPLLISC